MVFIRNFYHLEWIDLVVHERSYFTFYLSKISNKLFVKVQ